jgi:hypothetical protein
MTMARRCFGLPMAHFQTAATARALVAQKLTQDEGGVSIL